MTSLPFQTLLIIVNASCAVLAFGFLTFSLWPAAVRITLAHLVGIRSDVDMLCSVFTFSVVGHVRVWLGLLAGTPLPPLTHDVSTVNCLLPGFQMSMYSESYAD